MRGVFLLVLVCVLVFSPLCAQAEEQWYLRVVARDDTPAAQAEKYRVRDAVLAACPKDASALLHALPAIQAAADQIAPCQVEIRRWAPNEKTPAAPTVYITIGEAEGRNWWGVLYEDSLLLAQAKEDENAPETDGIIFLWPWLTWLKSLLFGI